MPIPTVTDEFPPAVFILRPVLFHRIPRDAHLGYTNLFRHPPATT
jgi:hypothetical protein